MNESEASDTALLIARATLYWFENPEFRYLVPVDAVPLIEHVLLASGVDVRRQRRLFRSRAVRLAVGLVERLILPGISMHYLLRKRLIEETVRQSITAGATQVLVLGAGFDTLAARLHREHPRVTFVEIDHPATQQVKLEGIGKSTAANLRFVAADLLHARLADVLEATVLQSHKNTIVVAEGVLMYLTERHVAQLFDDVRSAFLAEGSRFVFTFMYEDRGIVSFEHRRRSVDLLLKLKGEPFLWGAERSTGIAPWLQTCGFDALEIRAPADLMGRYVAADLRRRLPRPDGDTVCIAVPSRVQC